MTYLPRYALIAVIGAALSPIAVMAEGPAKWLTSDSAAQITLASSDMTAISTPSVRNDRLWEQGQRITRNYVRIRQPGNFGLNPNATYWRSYDYIYRVDAQTGEVLAQVGKADSIIGH
ncbi:MAG: hypothetical protein H5U24_12185 [Thioclava marina]|jgi:hypothetical protein|uniref:Uncharacterized protein n=1 Tax=Thioclava marina TaxID=1915077 RepID=A0ABX3MJ10_9RHOB|nr:MULTISPECIES: hypothetical protein [Thioclava]TNE91808.1 MAG: hypothetical protein EP337_06010 [Paracoccaceae bacterium]MBC7146147.1 hypothetical protein [Thioclava marina]MBD3802739.1 hypothetical protein [Thioclava sp.]OOY11407.1 hypothetical protein BMG00_16975 [Thioclava marina]OOY26728.1 hypothetical protein BMI90_16215 [Thioclava sp. L04-15]